MKQKQIFPYLYPPIYPKGKRPKSIVSFYDTNDSYIIQHWNALISNKLYQLQDHIHNELSNINL
jgi:hypothetical protein